MRGLQERIHLIKYDGILFNDLFAIKSPKVAVEWAIWKLCILVQTGDLYYKTVQCTDQCFTGINRSWCVSGQCLEQLRKIPNILCQDINLLSVNILTLTCDIVLHMHCHLMAVPLLRMFLRASVTACQELDRIHATDTIRSDGECRNISAQQSKQFHFSISASLVICERWDIY